MMNEEDLALETLCQARAAVAPDLPEELVAECYAIQKKHQFDSHRAISAQMMERLIDQYVDKIIESGAGK
ncbi:DNA modification system-associated small protein [Rhizorhabdus sp.]|jgi:hypothetical protein|uniref:DNA modification system-associated small protein n=1 Tax=Rhizorhabdus sp. TaxID=1968843 RepID=UPI0019BD899B|nr:DNA modification system-associated small protein [Rhizorhabdus sp.]MBD3761921.1 hypothetical protein [Rhizorhabdus sp.]